MLRRFLDQGLSRRSGATQRGIRQQRTCAPACDAAFTATRKSIGLDYARKKCAHEPVSDYWVAVARMMIKDLFMPSAALTYSSHRSVKPEPPVRYPSRPKAVGPKQKLVLCPVL